jgi:Co/Zn/Cd efflux system component
MSASCCHTPAAPARDGRFRKVLWIALILNAAMFAVEIVAGLVGRSVALTADAIDFLGDAGNYAISLLVVGMALKWRARAALLKAGFMGLYGVGVLGLAAYHAIAQPVPSALTMGTVGTVALIVNVAVAMLLFAYRSGDSNMRSIWLCSRNDAIGNLAVLAAALGVFGTGTVWPDLFVAILMAGLGLISSAQVFVQARRELKQPAPLPAE